MTPAELAALSGNPPQQEQQSSGFIDTLGKIALGAGLAGAALVGARRLGGTVDLSTVDLGKIRRGLGAAVRPSEAVPPPSRPAPATTAERLQRIDDVTRAARAERPQGVRQVALTGQKTDLPVARTPGTFQQFSREASGVAAAERLVSDPELLSLVKAQAAEELSEARSYQAKAQAEYRNLLSAEADSIIDSLRKEVSTVQSAAQSDFGPQEFLKAKGYVEDVSLVDQHRGQALGRVDHFANAVNSAEDQATGRVKLGMQRNEDVNLAAAEMAEDAVDSQIAKAAQADPAVASVSELDTAINQVASSLEDGIPFDQAEAAKIYAADVMQAQRERLAERGFRGQQLERRLVFPQSVGQALEASMPISAEDVLTVGRAEPQQIAPGGFVQPASKTSLRGTTGRPELGVLGIESGSTAQREVWGQGAVETEKRVYAEGENPVTRPAAFRPGIDLPEERTPEGYRYTQAAMTRPSKPGASRTPLVQPKTDVSRESVELSEQVRRIQREGGNVQEFLNAYKRSRANG